MRIQDDELPLWAEVGLGALSIIAVSVGIAISQYLNNQETINASYSKAEEEEGS